jgi:hypothetical protein
VSNSVALFIDLENIVTSFWKIHQQPPDIPTWLDRVRKYGTLSFGRAYGDFSQSSISALESDLRIFGIDKFDCPVKQNGQSTVDGNIIMDLYEVALDQPSVKTFVLMAGDSDYIRVVAKLRQRMDKEIVIMGVRGSVSRDLIRAGSIEDTIDPVALNDPATLKAVDEAHLIKLINQYEASRREGTLTTFRYLSQYLSDPRNAHIIDPRYINAKLNELVASGILVQEISKFEDGGEIRITKLDRTNPAVLAALSTS